MKTHEQMLEVAIQQAKIGLSEGGVPIGAALFDKNGNLLGAGHNRRVQNDDPATHAETDAFRNAGRQTDYRETILVTTLSPCWYCCGLIRQFKIGTVIIGENETFGVGEDSLRELGVKVIVMHNQECKALLGGFIEKHPEIWNEDIGEVCSSCEA
ncbi:MAG: nucleoside deaminase [Sulfurimonas sp.]|nr:nucleoside deaminase [Sulfurimonas sp.]